MRTPSLLTPGRTQRPPPAVKAEGRGFESRAAHGNTKPTFVPDANALTPPPSPTSSASSALLPLVRSLGSYEPGPTSSDVRPFAVEAMRAAVDLNALLALPSPRESAISALTPVDIFVVLYAPGPGVTVVFSHITLPCIATVDLNALLATSPRMSASVAFVPSGSLPGLYAPGPGVSSPTSSCSPTVFDGLNA
jgi:hypothetical protein